MRLQHSSLLILSLYLTAGLAIPVADPDANPDPQPNSPKLDERTVTPPTPPKPPSTPGCQSPIASNVCSSGSPYCCSGSGTGQVCGPASTTTCTTTTICCINTNGMQICAGEIDFTGPVTIINL